VNGFTFAAERERSRVILRSYILRSSRPAGAKQNPGDDFAKEVRAKLTSEPKRYAAYTREYLGWGVFALMAR